MKRLLSIFMVLFLLLLPLPVCADVAWTPPDPYLTQHSYTYLPPTKQHYIALCSGYLYTSPSAPTPCGYYKKGDSLCIQYTCMDSIHRYGLVFDQKRGYRGWIPMDALTLAYGPNDFMYDHIDACTPYAGEMDRLLPSQQEIDACNQYREQNDGGYGKGGTPPYWMTFDFPGYTAWAYPNAPLRYPDVYSVDIAPLYTYIDEAGETWIYARDAWQNNMDDTEGSFWILVSDPEAEPDPHAPALLPLLPDPPTHLPVPGEPTLQKTADQPLLKQFFPAILAVSGVVLFSALLIVILNRKKR